MKVIQCWDDGITADIPLIDVLRKYNSKATFNLNAGKHNTLRSNGWRFKNTDVVRLSKQELTDVYEGFTIANHSLTHPSLAKIPADEARMEIRNGRKELQDIFNQPIDGFAYPNGSYNQEVESLIKEEGHLYARTTKNFPQNYPPENPFALHPNCHFLSDDFWELYENAKPTGVFYFWGHSYEIISEKMLSDFENLIKQINEDPDSQWAEILDLIK